jgi:uncharacterized membrane protein
MIDATPLGIFIVISLMALVTLATRWGGVFVMSFIPINNRIKQFINGMSGAVLVAVLTPQAVEGDLAARLALISTALVVLCTRLPLVGITTGVAVAGFTRWVL